MYKKYRKGEGGGRFAADSLHKKAPGGIRRGKIWGPRESPQSGIFWGRGGMTERYEKSPIETDRAF